MKAWKPVIVGLGAIAVTTATLVPVWSPSRGVKLAAVKETTTTGKFDPRESAALFIGVRKFSSDPQMEVPFAADDAVDLAYAFAMSPRSHLVDPGNVVIALSGPPRKAESKLRLKELKQANARIRKAGHNEILKLLQDQAVAAGRNGMFIVSIATHGFAKEGIPYILDSTSDFRLSETALPLPTLFEIAATSEAQRSLFLIDACRERVGRGTRGGPDPRTAAISITRMGRARGQVIFYAAAQGGYAYDGDGNGVFTEAVLEGVNCKAALTRGAVTAETLRTFVERYVKKWIRTNKHLKVDAVTQVSMEGDSKNMPLATCDGAPPPPPPEPIDRESHEGSRVSAFSKTRLLWSHSVNGTISAVHVADLDADGSNDVLVCANSISVFGRIGNRTWSADEGMTLRTCEEGDLLPRDRSHQVVALWNDEGTSKARLSITSGKGQRLSVADHLGRLEHMAIDRPTAQHDYKIIVTGVDDTAGAGLGIRQPVATVSVLDAGSKPRWTAVLTPPTERITQLRIADFDNDSKRDISLSTATGNVLHVDFDGKVLPKSSTRLKLTVLPHKKQRKPRS